MITYEQAVARIRGLNPTLSTEWVPLADCGGRLLTENVIARVPSPPFTNSAMDGFAVRHEDVLGQPGRFPVIGTILARPAKPEDLPAARPGAVVRIMTGGAIPTWADTVVPVEQSQTDDAGRVRFLDVPPAGANIRRCGSDLAEGSIVLKAGQILNPERILVAAAFGHSELPVMARPHLALLSTGDELVEPGMPLPPGTVYNSSKHFLLASAKAIGYDAPMQQTLPDDESAAATAIETLLQLGAPTVIISTGAVSAGDADFIPRLSRRLGFSEIFHQVAIRPGKPVFLAAKGQVYWLGLPGNQVSTAVGWHFFARPLLAAFGLPPAMRRTLVLQNEVRKPEGLRCFFRAEVSGAKAWVAERQGSGQLAASITNDAYVELPEGFSRIPAETRVEAIIA